MERQLPDTPWHVGYTKKDEDDPRRHKARCIHYVKGKCHCINSPYYDQRCWGSSHCEEYAEYQTIEIEQSQKRSKTSKTVSKGDIMTDKEIEKTFTLTKSDDGYHILELLDKDIDYIKLPDSYQGVKITQINEYAFSDSNNSLKVFEMSNNISYMEVNAFYNSSIRSITFSPRLKVISKGCFQQCSDLHTLHFSEGLEVIEQEAFWDCVSLTQIDLPESIREIHSGAFSDCTQLEKIYIPRSATEISMHIFDSELDDANPNLIIRCYKDSYAYERFHTLYQMEIIEDNTSIENVQEIHTDMNINPFLDKELLDFINDQKPCESINKIKSGIFNVKQGLKELKYDLSQELSQLFMNNDEAALTRCLQYGKTIDNAIQTLNDIKIQNQEISEISIGDDPSTIKPLYLSVTDDPKLCPECGGLMQSKDTHYKEYTSEDKTEAKNSIQITTYFCKKCRKYYIQRDVIANINVDLTNIELADEKRCIQCGEPVYHNSDYCWEHYKYHNYESK